MGGFMKRLIPVAALAAVALLATAILSQRERPGDR
jgi:hypothetical protein